MTTIKTRHCDKCKYGRITAIEGMLKPHVECLMLHKPRFYAPDYFDRATWGYKRKCEDFSAKEKRWHQKKSTT